MFLTREEMEILEAIREKGFDGVPIGMDYLMPTILIGLGGLGCKILNQLKKKLQTEYGKRQFLRYLAVDSDINDLHKIMIDPVGKGNQQEKQERYLKEAEIFHLCSTEILKKPKPEWMDENIQWPFSMLDYGFGGYRQIGRYMLESMYCQLKEKLSCICHEMADWGRITGSKPIHIILISGTGGGTGGGTIVGISYMIHQIMSDAGFDDDYDFSAYLVTPDIQMEEAKKNERLDMADWLDKNGQAVQEEIDFFMNLQDNHGEYKWDFGNGIRIVSTRNIFDSCTIITGREENGNTGNMKSVINKLTERIAITLSNTAMSNMAGYCGAENSCHRNISVSDDNISMNDIHVRYLAGIYERIEDAYYCRPDNNISSYDAEISDFLSELELDNLINTVVCFSMEMGLDIKLQIHIPEKAIPFRQDLRDNPEYFRRIAEMLASVQRKKIEDQIFYAKLKEYIIKKLNHAIWCRFNAIGSKRMCTLLKEQILVQLDHTQKSIHARVAYLFRVERTSWEEEQQQLLERILTLWIPNRRRIENLADVTCRIAMADIFYRPFYQFMERLIEDITHEMYYLMEILEYCIKSLEVVDRLSKDLR